MYTWKGRVVYNRKVHLFKFRDVGRILRKMRKLESLEDFVIKSQKTFIDSMEVIEEDYVDAFRFSIWAFWQDIVNPEFFGTYGEFYSKSRSLGADLEAARQDLAEQAEGIPSTWDWKEYGIRMSAVMIDIIEQIKEKIDASS